MFKKIEIELNLNSVTITRPDVIDSTQGYFIGLVCDAFFESSQLFNSTQISESRSDGDVYELNTSLSLITILGTDGNSTSVNRGVLDGNHKAESKEVLVCIGRIASESFFEEAALPLCLGFCQISLLDVEDGLLSLELTDPQGTIAVLSCSLVCTPLTPVLPSTVSLTKRSSDEADDETDLDLLESLSEAIGVSSATSSQDALHVLATHFDTRLIMQPAPVSNVQSVSFPPNENTNNTAALYASLFSLLRSASRDSRTQIALNESNSSLLAETMKERIELRQLVNELSKRLSESQSQNKRLMTAHAADQTLLTAIAPTGHNATANRLENVAETNNRSDDLMQTQLTEVIQALELERGITMSLRKELSLCVSREELNQLRTDLELARAQSMYSQGVCTGVMQVLQQAASLSSSEGNEVTLPSAELLAAMKDILNSSTTTALAESARKTAELEHQRTSLLRHNHILTEQVTVLLQGIGLTSSPFPCAAAVDMDAVEAQVGTETVSPLAGSSTATNFAIIADLERSLAYCQQLLQQQQLQQYQPDMSSQLQGMQAELTESKTLCDEYYSKLQAGSEYVKRLQLERDELKEHTEILQVKAVTARQVELQDVNAKYSELKEELENALAENEKLLVALQDRERQLEFVHIEKASLQAELTETKISFENSTMVAATNTLATPIDSNITEDKEITVSQSMSAESEFAELASARTELDELDAQLEEAQSLASQYYDRLTEGARAYSRQAEQLETAQVNQAKAEEQLEVAIAKIAELQAQLKELSAHASINNEIQVDSLGAVDKLSIGGVTELDNSDSNLGIEPFRQEESLAKVTKELEEAEVRASQYYDRLQEGAIYTAHLQKQLDEARAQSIAAKTEPVDQSSLSLSMSELGGQDSVIDLENQILELEKKLILQNEVITELEVRSAQYYERLQQGAEYTANLQKQLDEANDRMYLVNEGGIKLELEKQIREQQEQIAELESASNQYYERLQKGAEYTANLQRQLDEANARMSSTNDDSIKLELEKQIEEQQAQIEELETASNKYYEQLQQGAAYTAKLQQQLDDAHAATIISSTHINTDNTKELESKIAKLVLQIEEQQAQIEDLDIVSNQYYERLQQGAEYTAKLQQQLDDATIAASANSARNGELEKQIVELKAQIEELEETAAKYYDRLEQGALYTADLQRQLEEAKLLNQKSSSGTSAFTVTALGAVTLGASAGQLTATTEKDDSSKLDLEKQIVELKAQIEELEETAAKYYDRLEQGASYTADLQRQLEEAKLLNQKSSSGTSAFIVTALGAATLGASAGQLTATTEKDDSSKLDLEKQIVELKAQIEELEETAAKYYDRLEQGASFTADLQRQLKSAVESKDKLAIERDDLLQQLSGIQAAMSATPSSAPADQWAEREADMQREYEAELIAKAETIADLTRELEEAEGNASEMSEAVTKYRERLQHSAEYTEGLRAALAEAEAELEIRRTKTQELQDEVNRLLIQTSLYQSVAEAAEEKGGQDGKFRGDDDEIDVLKSLKSKVRRLEQQLADSEEIIEDLQQLSTKDAQQSLNIQVTDLQDQIDDLQTKLSVRNAEYDELLLQLHTAKEQLENLQSQLQLAQVAIDRLQHQLDFKETELAEAKIAVSAATTSSRDNGISGAPPVPGPLLHEDAHRVEALLQELIAAKMELARAALDAESERQASRLLRAQLQQTQNMLPALSQSPRQGQMQSGSKSAAPTQPVKKKSLFG